MNPYKDKPTRWKRREWLHDVHEMVYGFKPVNKILRLSTKPKLLTGIGFGGEPIRARVTV